MSVAFKLAWEVHGSCSLGHHTTYLPSYSDDVCPGGSNTSRYTTILIIIKKTKNKCFSKILAHVFCKAVKSWLFYFYINMIHELFSLLMLSYAIPLHMSVNNNNNKPNFKCSYLMLLLLKFAFSLLNFHTIFSDYRLKSTVFCIWFNTRKKSRFSWFVETDKCCIWHTKHV